MLRILMFLAIVVGAPAHACGGESACLVGDRSYRAETPQAWDGDSALPVLLHFHGWGRQGINVLRNKRVSGPASENGMLLIAPDGLGKSWSFWGENSRDVDFVDRVLADAARRWPIDRSRVYISGFSYGGAMAWRLACQRGNAFAGYLPIAGGLWRQSDVDCAGPVRLAHVHGLNDNIYGLPIGPFDEVEDGVLLWRRMNNVQEPPEVFDHDRYTCRSWEAALTLCTHEGGHFIPKDWLGWMLPRMMRDAGS
ncbi:MAG: polyhydroxybutyrate depolymerase [Pseudomonadota bacterium]